VPLALFLTCFVSLVVATALLLLLGDRVRLAAVVSLARPLWNPVGQVFFASFVAAALAYLAFAATVTFAGGLSPLGIAASALLLGPWGRFGRSFRP
jgi:hypothetical protein